MIRDWDADTYDRVADPQARWGAAVLERLPLVGDERVLDAGCGSGRVTELLAERLPDGRVIALDASPAMIDQARARLARFGDRIEFVVADLAEPLSIQSPVDAILSTATFHWIADHDALFRHLAAVIRPGGRLVAQFGGRGNIASVVHVLAEIGELADNWPPPKEFAGPLDTARRLTDAGFVDVEAWLQDEPTSFEPDEPFHAFLRTVILRQHLDALPHAEREPFVREVARRLERPELDYVRLNVDALRGLIRD
jgi:trans-aconitate 2-methyltransferase